MVPRYLKLSSVRGDAGAWNMFLPDVAVPAHDHLNALHAMPGDIGMARDPPGLGVDRRYQHLARHELATELCAV